MLAELISKGFVIGSAACCSSVVLDTLVPAYAATIHKSQGSEYPAVVIPVVAVMLSFCATNRLVRREALRLEAPSCLEIVPKTTGKNNPRSASLAARLSPQNFGDGPGKSRVKIF